MRRATNNVYKFTTLPNVPLSRSGYAKSSNSFACAAARDGGRSDDQEPTVALA